MNERPDITQLLRAHERGEGGALEEAVRFIYGDLKRLAHRQLRNPHLTLDTTALVHEAYLRLVHRDDASWNDRRHFLAAAATAMRYVIVDRVRERMAAKRGGGIIDVTLDDRTMHQERESPLALEVNAALDRLREIDPRLVQVVECRFFAGFTVEETAGALTVSPRTVERDWMRARAWLRNELDRQRGD